MKGLGKMIVNMHAPISSADGYGSTGCNLMLGLDALGVDVIPFNMFPRSTNKSLLPTRILELMDKKQKEGDLSYYVMPAFDRFYPRHKDQKVVAMSMLETTRIPDKWVERYNEADLIHNPSKWGKEIFQNNGVTVPIEIINLGVPDSEIKYYSREFSKPFVFLFMAVEINDSRKNVQMLVKAFEETFGDNPEIELWLKTKTKWNMPIPDGDNIVIIEGEAGKEYMKELWESAHCFVFSTRSEGFGLPPVEAMATGCPTIVTDYSSMKEFVNKEYCYPLNIDGMETINQETSNDANLFNYPVHTFGKDIGKWSIPSKEHLKELMIHVYENYDEALEKGKRAYDVVKEKWPYSKTVDNVYRSLERVLQ